MEFLISLLQGELTFLVQVLGENTVYPCEDAGIPADKMCVQQWRLNTDV